MRHLRKILGTGTHMSRRFRPIVSRVRGSEPSHNQYRSFAAHATLDRMLQEFNGRLEETVY